MTSIINTITNPNTSSTHKRKLSIKWITIGILLLIGIGGFYSYILAQRLMDRSFISSVSSYIDRKIVRIGANGYGQISSIKVQEGQTVSQGDTIFTFLQTDKENIVKEIKVTSLSEGTVTEIKYGIGSYVTPDTTVVELQSKSTLVKSKLKIEPTELSKLQIGSPTLTELPSGAKIIGTIFSIKPSYDKKEKLVEIESKINRLEEEAYNGTPVSLKVYVGDTLSTKTAVFIQNLEIPNLTMLLLADWNTMQAK